MADFSEWKVEDATDVVSSNENGAKNRAFYDGDHWQGGDGWPSPRLPESNYTGAQIAAQVKAVEAVFTPKNVINEIVDRHLSAVIGRPPSWRVQLRRPLAEGEEPNEAEETLISLAENLLSKWTDTDHGIVTDEEGEIDLVSPHRAAKEAVREAVVTGRAGLRLRVPTNALTEGEDGSAQMPRMAIEDAIGKVYVQMAAATQAGVHVDKDSLEKIGIFVYDDGGKKAAELSYLEEGQTIIRIVDQPETRLDLGGRLTIYQIKRTPLVNETVRRLQIAVNKALTTANENLSYAFKERIFVNTLPPGTWSKNEETGEEEYTASGSLDIGAGRSNFFTGTPIYDETTGTLKGYATGSIHYEDPTPPDVYERSKEMFYRAILEEVDQLHALISGDATASGISRVQAKGDFAKSLSDTKEEAESALGWLFETVLAMAAVFAGEPNKFADLRVTAECQIDLGIITPEERAQNNADYTAGTLSRETTIRANGIVDDAAAEIQRIDMEENNSLTAKKTKADIAQVLGNTPGAFAVAEFSDADQAALLRSDFVSPNDEVQPTLNGSSPNGQEEITENAT